MNSGQTDFSAPESSSALPPVGLCLFSLPDTLSPPLGLGLKAEASPTPQPYGRCPERPLVHIVLAPNWVVLNNTFFFSDSSGDHKSKINISRARLSLNSVEENLFDAFLLAYGVANGPWQSLAHRAVTPVSASVCTWSSPHMSVSLLL